MFGCQQKENNNLKEEKLTIHNIKVKNTKTLIELYKGELYRKPWVDVYVPEVQVSFKLDELVNTIISDSKIAI